MGSKPAPGEVLAGKYRIERILGEGGMGIVAAAEHLVLGEKVAVKMLLPDAALIPEVVPRFQREAKAAARIQSEHVARVMDVGVTEDGSPYLVMEYVEGRDLNAELEERGPLPVEDAVGYVLQAAVGVAEAHALGIVHRDLKPSNLFLARLPNGRTLVKVLDFGIAKDASDSGAGKELTSTFSALGSASYMSPEQVRMAKGVDARSDVWAFGVVLFELLTGEMPFDGESVTAIAAAIAMDRPKSLRGLRPEIPEKVEAAILGCLEKDRALRTPSLAALANALAPFGGSYAPVLAGRIAEALRSREPFASAPEPVSVVQALPGKPEGGLPSSRKPEGGLPASRKAEGGLPSSGKPDGGQTRGSWATTEIAPRPSRAPGGVRFERRMLVASVAGGALLLLVGVTVTVWGLSSSHHDAGTTIVTGAGSTAAPVQVAAPQAEPQAVSPAPAPSSAGDARPRAQNSQNSAAASPRAAPPTNVAPKPAPLTVQKPRVTQSKPSGPSKPGNHGKPLVTAL